MLIQLLKKVCLQKKPLFLLESFFKSQLFQSIDKSYKSINDFDSDFHFHSVLDENVEFSQCFATHLLTLNCIDYRDRKSFSEILREVTDDVETFLRNLAVIPLRYIAASELSDYNFFVRNSQDTIVALISFKFKKSIKTKFTPTFSLIQLLLKTTENVDDFILMIISTFGFFNSVRNEEVNDEARKLDDTQNRNLLFVIYNFVLCLIFDTLCTERNFFAMKKLSVISMLMKNDLSVDEINKIWYKKVLSDEKFCDDLASFASKVETKNGSKFHLKDNSDWHPLLPFLELSSIVSLVQKFIDENPDSLINFPSIPNDSIHLLFSPTLWALHYYILSQKCCKDYQVIQQFVFNTLIITSQNSEKFYKDKNNQESSKNSILKVKDFCDFAFQLKKFTFNDFLTVKVVFSKSENEPKSMVDLISIFGNVGITVLTRLNISNEGENSIEESRQKKEELIKKNRERAKQLKMQIMSNFNKKQKSFQISSSLQENENDEREKDEVENSSKIVCRICQIENENDCFVYPALIYKNSLQSYIKWRFRKAQIGSEFSTDFSEIPKSFDSFNYVRICMHPIHSKCIHADKFTCPFDRCPRNASIPIIAGLFDEKTELDKKVFLQAQNFLKKAYHNDIKFALFSLASQIEILEMRHRSNPGCLDDVLNQATLRNIYLCIWHVMRKEASKIVDFGSTRNSKKMEFNLRTENQEQIENFMRFISSVLDENHPDDDDTRNEMIQHLINERMNRKTIRFTPLMFYITSFLIEKNVELDAFASDDFVFNFKDDLDSDYKWLQFLRCVAIFDHFARGIKITQNENEKAASNNEFIDWDAILSPSNLCKHYNVHRVVNSNNNNNDNTNNNDDNTNNNDNDNANNNNDNANNNNDNTNNNNNDNAINNNNDNTNSNNDNAINNNNDNANNNNNDNANNNNNDDHGDASNDEMTLPMFSLINLPKNFLDFIHPPFSAPILESNDCEVLLCLLTGKTVLKKSSSSPSQRAKYIKLSQFLDNDFDRSFSVFLVLNGANASQVIIGDAEFNRIFILRSFYTDTVGDKDVGMKRGSLLYLNEPIIEEIIDEILSGSWTNSIHFE